MPCPECDAEQLAFPVPDDIRGHLPDDRPAATVCTRCLSVTPADEAPAGLPEFRTMSDALPTDRGAAAALLLALGLADSLAVYRAEIDALLGVVERAGADPLLAMDRLAGDPDLDPALDLDRRSRQVEQLLS